MCSCWAFFPHHVIKIPVVLIFFCSKLSTRDAFGLPAMSVTDLQMAVCSCKSFFAFSPMSESSAVEEPESLLEEDISSGLPAVAVFGALYGGSPSVDVGSWMVIAFAGFEASMSTARAIGAPRSSRSGLECRLGSAPSTFT